MTTLQGRIETDIANVAGFASLGDTGRRLGRATFLLGTSLLVYAAAASPAHAANECGVPPPGGGTVTCTPAGNPYPDGIDYDPVAVDLTVVLESGVIVDNDGSVTNPNGVEMGSSTMGVDLELLGATNTTISTDAASHDAVDVVSTDGTVRVEVDDVDTAQDDSRGIVASGRGTTIVAADTVATLGDNSDGISAEEGNFLSPGVPPDPGGTSVTADFVSTGGENSFGILAFSENGDSVVDVATVTTGGDYSTGILAISAVSNVEVTSGSVTTSGANSIGIDALIFPFPDEVPVGTVLVDSGTVETSGDGAIGIIAAAPTTDVTVNSVSVSTEGDYAHGIIALITGQYTGPDTYVYGDGDIVIDSGTVATEGGDADGIVAVGADAVTITSESVSTQGDRSSGIYALTYFDGAVVITSGSVTTAGNTDPGNCYCDSGTAYGIHADTFEGMITIDSTSVETGGYAAIGILATSDEGAINITSATVTTAGDRAAGIWAETTQDSQALALSGAPVVAAAPLATPPGISITSTSVTTDGDNAPGIAVSTVDGDIYIESGSVDTSGVGSGGIEATVTGGGDIEVTSASVTTDGNYSTGIEAISYSGAITIDSGAVDVSGNDSRGISAIVATGLGAISITSDSMNVAGPDADGIYARGLGEILVDSGDIDHAGAANAIDVLTASPGGDIIVTSGDITKSGAQHAIVAHTTDGDVSVTSASIVSTFDDDESYGDGILAISQDGNVTVDSGVVVTPSGNGITALAFAGDVSVTSDAVTTGGDTHTGIYGTSDAGNVDIDSGTVATTGENSLGIIGQTDSGSVTITSDSVTTSGDIAAGILAEGTAAVVVTSTSVTTDGDASAGIDAYSSDADVTVDSGTIVTTGDSSTGIIALGGNDVTVTSTNVTTSGYESVGIDADTAGGHATVISGSVTTSGDYATGILAYSGGGNAQVTTTGTSATSGPGANAIDASAVGGGNADVTSATATTQGDLSNGIEAEALGGGNVSITSGNVTTAGEDSVGIYGFSDEGDTDIVSTGTVQTSGDGADGIVGVAAGTVTIESNIVITTGDDAAGIVATELAEPPVEAVARAAGAVTVAALGPDGGVTITSGSVTTSGAGSAGIDAEAADGDVEVFSAGTVTTTGTDSDGIIADSDNGFAMVDANNVGVSGGGSDAILITSDTDIDVVVRGLVESTQGFAVQADGAPAMVSTTPSGTIRGRVDLTDGADTLANAGTFDAIGTSQFGGGTDVFTNSGTTRSVNGAAVLGGLETFNSSGVVTMADGAANDRLTVGDFVGLAGGRLIIDVDFNANAADLLVTGAATGSTILQIGASGAPLAFTGGILVVDGAAGTSPTAFTLGAGGTIANGYVTSGLIFRASDFDFLLINTPNQPVFETSQVGEIVTNVWQQSADAVFAQIESASDRPEAQRRNGSGFGVWGQMWAGGEQFEGAQPFALGATTTVFDVGYRQDYEGVQGGIDHQSDNLLFGVTFGLGSSDADFVASGNRLDIDIVNLGAYAGFRAGIFYVNALVKYDWLDVTTNPGPGLSAAFEANEWGAQVDAGARFAFGRLFAEPSVGISWISADIDEHGGGGAAIRFDEAESLRGYAGLRLGGVFDTGGAVFAPSVGARVIEEFNGENENDFILGTPIHFVDQAPDTYGELSAGLSAITDNIEVFVRGEMLIGGDDVDGESVRGGVRIRF